jgi:hypothetical protein
LPWRGIASRLRGLIFLALDRDGRVTVTKLVLFRQWIKLATLRQKLPSGSKPPVSDFGAPWIKIKSKSMIKDQM